MSDLAWARRVLKDATPGPWQTHGGRDAFWRRSVQGSGEEVAWCGHASLQAYADARAIALLGSTALAMLDVVEAAAIARISKRADIDDDLAELAAALDRYCVALKEVSDR